MIGGLIGSPAGVVIEFESAGGRGDRRQQASAGRTMSVQREGCLIEIALAGWQMGDFVECWGLFSNQVMNQAGMKESKRSRTPIRPCQGEVWLVVSVGALLTTSPRHH